MSLGFNRCLDQLKPENAVPSEAEKPIEFVYVDANGRDVPVCVESGTTLMQAARDHQVSGIDADCGGSCACGTCLVELPAAVAAALAGMSDEEAELVSFMGDGNGPLRLGCQVPVMASMSGITVKVATGR